MSLREDQIQRYSRHILLPEIGGRGQERLLASRVEVNLERDRSAAEGALHFLAAAGLGTLILRGGDSLVVSRAVLEQSLSLEADDLGQDYRSCLRRHLQEQNPDVRVSWGEERGSWKLDPLLDAEEAPPIAEQGLAAATHRGCCAATRLLHRILSS